MLSFIVKQLIFYLMLLKISCLTIYGEKISDDVKQLSFEIAAKHKVTIKHMETDKDHIHYMIETDPTIRLSDFIRTIKSYTTFHIWKIHEPILKKHFWKELTFWTKGYFVCSIGNISEASLKKYIEEQNRPPSSIS